MEGKFARHPNFEDSTKMEDTLCPRVAEKIRRVVEQGLPEKIKLGDRCAAEEKPKVARIPIRNVRSR